MTDRARVEEGSQIDPFAEVGYCYGDGCGITCLGPGARVRRGAIIYADVTAGADLAVGHFALVREHTQIGDQVVIGTQVVIEGHVTIGSRVKIESGAFLPTHTRIGSRVFIGPHAVLTNDRYPLRRRDEYEAAGPTIADDVSLGAGCVILPAVCVGEGSIVAAGCIVTRDVPPWSLARGVPARYAPLPDEMMEENRARSWKL